MATIAKEAKKASPPPYIPWKTFSNFIERWKKDTVPHTIDTSVMTNLAGGIRPQVVSALRFLKLVDTEGVVQPEFASLVEAHGTEQWPGAVKEYVVSAYDQIVGDLPLENAIASQLDERFRSAGGVEGQVLDKCVRFYLHGLRDAEVKYSPHFTARRERNRRGAAKSTRGTKSRPASSGTKKQESVGDSYFEKNEKLELGLIEIPLTIPGKPSGQKIVVSMELDDADCDYIDAMLRAQAKRISVAKGDT